jgi:ABC transporter DrrB family efflux protein
MNATITAPTSTPSATRASIEVARRALRRYFRTPGVFIVGLVQSALFLFCFRFVFGGAIHTSTATYVAYLVPGYVATIVLFNGSGIAVAVSEDRAEGFTDRLLSLPIPRRAIVIGRAVADATTNAWAIVTTVAFGFLFGFRLVDGVANASAALGLCLLYGITFTFVFMVIGLIAPNGQAAQGMSMIAFVLAFFSSTYVPIDTMPGWLQPFAAHQPVTPMVEAVRSALVGSSHDVGLAIVWSAALIAVFLPMAVLRYRHA